VLHSNADVDECIDQAEPVCDAAATCTNTLGSYICTCKPPKVGDGKTCVGMTAGHEALSTIAMCSNPTEGSKSK
jgi:hypothetical protein